VEHSVWSHHGFPSVVSRGICTASREPGMAGQEQWDTGGRESTVVASRSGSGNTGEGNATEIWAVSSFSRQENGRGRLKLSTLAYAFRNDKGSERPQSVMAETRTRILSQLQTICKKSATDPL